MTSDAPKISSAKSASPFIRDFAEQILDRGDGTRRCEEEEASVNLLVLKEQKAVLTFPRLL